MIGDSHNSALTTLEMDLDYNNNSWKRKKGQSLSFQPLVANRKKREIVWKDFLSRALWWEQPSSQSIKEYLLDRMIARVLKKNEEARAVFFILYATTKRLGSLSRARARGFHRLRAASFFLAWFSYLLKLDTQKVNSERRARALWKREIFSRERQWEEESVRTWTLVALRPATDAICWVAANIMCFCVCEWR